MLFYLKYIPIFVKNNLTMGRKKIDPELKITEVYAGIEKYKLDLIGKEEASKLAIEALEKKYKSLKKK